ncbi:hypothetical protein BRADI_2g24446v3 [Brachypodium distachyon]|uniref:Secreted protein n=1 Tax=Brachypodium distachyon TaxID=15368 RepID=A0A2K2DA84_BRADI|nr:hypothetical protein BRADI_2g24446v3 [Brachypodium distachyon]
MGLLVFLLASSSAPSPAPILSLEATPFTLLSQAASRCKQLGSPTDGEFGFSIHMDFSQGPSGNHWFKVMKEVSFWLKGVGVISCG